MGSVVLSLFFVATAVAATSSPGSIAACSGKKPVVVVADVGVDDAAALLWAIAAPELQVLGVASSFGCHNDPRVTARNARRLLAAGNRSDIPVHVGSRFPLGFSAALEGDGSMFHGEDGFSALPLDESEPEPHEFAETSAAELIVANARAHAGELVVLSFSPLVDVALALLLEPTLPLLLKALVVMGGAVFTHGNAAPLAEANFHHDAAAAQLVLRGFAGSGRLVLAPLDVTMSATLGAADVQHIGALGAGPRLFERAWPIYQGAYCKMNALCDRAPVHDAVPVAWAIDPGMFNMTRRLTLNVHASEPGGPSHGMSWVDTRPSVQEGSGSNVEVLLAVDRDRLVKRLMLDLTRNSHTA